MTHPERETGGLCEIRALAEAATAGPWRRDENNVWGACDPDDTTSYGMGINIVECRSSAAQWAREPLDYEKSERNAAFIAAANPVALIALLNEGDAQAAELERLRGALEVIGVKANLAAAACDSEGRAKGFQIIADQAARALKTEAPQTNTSEQST